MTPAAKLLNVLLAALAAGAAMRAAGQSAGEPAARHTPTLPVVGTRAAGFNAPQQDFPTLPLALEGFCPVMLHDRREWAAGRMELAAAFDGRWYYFSGERQRAIFAAGPETYAPAFGGDCLVTFVATGQRTAGSLQFGTLYRDRMYFFADGERAAEFQVNPTAYVDADLFRGGVCPVTYATIGQGRQGDPATELTYAGGWRFRFANASARRRFLATPESFLDDSFAAQIQRSALGQASLSPGAQAAERGRAPGVGIVPPAGSKTPVVPPASATAQGAGRRSDDHEFANANASEPMLNGYCPVSIWTRPDDPWVQGRYDQRRAFEDMVFMPAGPSERELFDADPALYIPALAGDCVVTYVETGKRVKGNMYHAVTDLESHRLYLCVDEAAAERLHEDPARYALVDCAAGGKCVVSRRDQGVDVPGDPQIGVWLEGQRYLFVDDAAREKFLADQETYTAPIGE
ncbi:MAG: hypothetical protein KDA44_22470 [Planctomycetales bacterium]|nr:hypothetical protein [Planctomycetales bacterium]